MTNPFPTPFGRYFLVGKIATGGMAEIFKAKLIGVEGFEKTVVIKRIHPFWSTSRDFITMLVDEAKILVHLNHPNIVQVFELGKEADSYFIAMEFVEGIDLRELLNKLQQQKKTIPQEFCIHILIEALRGLHYVHHRSLKDRGPLQIVHRDISPQNILLSYDGHVKVTDFGIAKAMTQTHETQTGVVKGKYAYMSPEQASGQTIDLKSDLFSCGVLLYELLFHQRLFSGKNDIEILDKVRRVQIDWPEPSEKISQELLLVLKKALALKPEDRFTNAEEFLQRLEECLPHSKRNDAPEMAKFLADLFGDEIHNRRLLEREITQRTEDFIRKTKVIPDVSGETVSIVESYTELEPEKKIPFFFKVQRKIERVFRPFLLHRRAAGLLLMLSILIPLLGFGFKKFVWEETPIEPAISDQTQVSNSPKRENSLENPESPLGDISGGNVVFHEVKKPEPELTQPIRVEPAITPVKKKVPSFGSLRVNAVPWGKVSMSGYIQGGETPVIRGGIPEGKYLVTVSNPALQKRFTATAVMRGGKTTHCNADFEGGGGMRCR